MQYLYENINLVRQLGIINSIPNFIEKNLSENIKLRDYQISALEDFIWYVENDLSRNKQIWTLFHMATGSGKTVIIAALILYYYQQGYRNFIFFVKNINIIDKTIENLTNSLSKKYLFTTPIEIDGRRISIKKVNNFQESETDSINICFTSNAGLQNSLSLFPKENSLSMSDFEDEKIVMIADESHHLNAATINGQFVFDDEEDTSWESTVMKAFRSNKDNVLLEFTATCDVKNPYVEQKYKDVIVFDYPLAKFREDLYSKDIISLPSTDDFIKRVIIAMIISQYRYKLFQKYKYNIKPIMMLKSKTIAESNEFYDSFYDFLNNRFNITYIETIKNENVNENLISSAFEFFSNENIALDNLFLEIKIEFAEEHSIMLNTKRGKISPDEARFLNSLENIENPFRIIFVVDMLNEGWDVLNLYDIVRLYDTRDGKWSNRTGVYTPGKTTISEMQLIGRGARYFPFKIEDWQIANKRKYDDQRENPLRICETLIYHCTTDNRYISEIRQVLKESGLISSDEPKKIELKLRDSFKNEKIYKTGVVYTNKRVEKSKSNVNKISDSIRSSIVDVIVNPTAKNTVDLFDSTMNISQQNKKTNYLVKDIPYNILNKGIRQFPLLTFDRLLINYPNLKSTKEFLYDDNYLGEITISITHPDNYDLTNGDVLNSTMKLFNMISNYVSTLEVIYEGTLDFYKEPLKNYIKDMTVYRNISDGATAGDGISQKVDSLFKFDLSNEDWYAYEDNFGTSEEKSLVLYFSLVINNLRTKYSKVFLIRNERQIGIYSFTEGRRFEPDYLLILGNGDPGKNTVYYQVFIEPKGNQFLDDNNTFQHSKESWKENFLIEIVNKKLEYKVFADGTKYKIWGLPFYNNDNTKGIFDNKLKELIL